MENEASPNKEEVDMYPSLEHKRRPAPWNKGKLCGQKRPLKLQEIWAIRIRLELAEKNYELALFNLAIDSKLRACDLVKLKVADVTQGAEFSHAPGLHSRKLTSPFSLRSHLRHGSLWKTGYLHRISAVLIFCLEAECRNRPTSLPGNMPVS